jgi:hypothetical protein
MKWFIPVLCAAILGIGAFGPAEAQAQKRGRGKPQHIKRNGHSVLPKSKLKRVGNGPVKVDKKGKHHIFANLRNGKVAGMHAKNARGKVVQATRKRVPARRRVSADLPADLYRVSASTSEADLVPVQDGGFVIIFQIQITINVIISYSFPESSCTGGDDPPDDGGDPGVVWSSFSAGDQGIAAGEGSKVGPATEVKRLDLSRSYEL